MIECIVKRNGSKQEFKKEKMEKAIAKAIKATYSNKEENAIKREAELLANNAMIDLEGLNTPIVGLEQVQENSSNPKKIWTITYGGNSDTMSAMHTFWENHKDGTTFYWTPPKPFDTQGIYRFATDKWNPSAKYGCGDTGTSFGIQGFTVELQLRQVS